MLCFSQLEPLEPRFCLTDGTTLSTLATAADYSLLVNSTGRLAVMELSPAEYESWQTGQQSPEQKETLVERLYAELPDAFDFIFIINNEEFAPLGTPYSGLHHLVQNSIQGLGLSDFDATADYGSAGELDGVIHLTSRSNLLSGPSLHELMHTWGNFLPEIDGGSGHWGFSSVGGQLGGWQYGTLQDLGNGLYAADGPQDHPWFTTFANGGNSLPYSQLELYLMGLIDADDVTDPIQLALNATFDGPGADFDEGIFRASGIETLTLQDIIDAEGIRSPSVADSQKAFRALTLVVTSEPLTQSELDEMDSAVEFFSRSAYDQFVGYNFWEATGRRATLQMDGLTEIAHIPFITSPSTATVQENTLGVLTVTATEAGLPASEITYSLSGGVDQSRFFITPEGLLTFIAAPNFEIPTDSDHNNTYLVQVSASNGTGGVAVQNLSVTVTNVNEPPTNISLSSTIVQDDNFPPTAVGTLSASDPETDDTFSFSLVEGASDTDNLSFAIDRVSLIITVVADSEVQSSYSIRVRVTDQGGLSFENTFTIHVEDPPQLSIGQAVTWIKRHPPVAVLPLVTVQDNGHLGGGLLTINLIAAGNRRALDSLTYSIGNVPGSTAGLTYADRQLTLRVQLSPTATAADVQAFLREIRFSTKGAGLRTPNRFLTVRLADNRGLSTTQFQEIQVLKKAPRG